jgi:hypothetical protein
MEAITHAGVVDAPQIIIATEHWALKNLAVEINAALVETEAHARAAVAGALQLGRLLTQAKDCAAKGTWEAWLTANCPSVAHRTARAYMSFAERFEKLVDADRQRVAALPLRDAIRAIATDALGPVRQT